MSLIILDTRPIDGGHLQLQRTERIEYPRGRVVLKFRYHVEVCEEPDVSITVESPLNQYHFASKAEALKHFKSCLKGNVP